MPVLTVPAPLRKQLGEEAADSLVVFINAANDESRDNVIDLVGDRFERRMSDEVKGAEVRLGERITQVEARLGERITQVEARLDRRISEEIASLRVEFNERLSSEIAGLRVEFGKEFAALRVEIANSRSELIRWMFGFWIGQIAVIVALFALLR